MRMNNLLEQANIRMAEIEETACDLESIKSIEQIKDELYIVLCSDRSGTRYLRGLSVEKMQELKNIVLEAVIDAKEEKTRELERLLGIEKSVTVMKNCITEEEVVIPEVPKDKPEYPKMTVESVKGFYHNQDMTLDEVAKVFGVSRSYLYKFVTKNNLRKPSKREQKLFRDADVEKQRSKEPKSEKERP